jgi:hypothetical protein
MTQDFLDLDVATSYLHKILYTTFKRLHNVF